MCEPHSQILVAQEGGDQPVCDFRMGQRKYMPAIVEFLIFQRGIRSRSTSTISLVGCFVSRAETTGVQA